jgi:predicted sulfurtransferase
MIKKVVLFYKYIHIERPHAFRDWQRELCTQLNLKGRILIAFEGMNGTASGDEAMIDAYIETMKQHPLCADIDFKTSYASDECFPKLKVKVRNYIVNFGAAAHTVSVNNAGVHLKPHEFHARLSANEQGTIVLDARNAFEARIGKFANAVVPPIDYFRDLPAYIDANSELFKDKTVLMYCTGGIRCEIASAYLKSKNVAKEVYQLEGGIHRYVEAFPEGHFRGKNYVFDGRIAMGINDDVLSTCISCDVSCDDYTNCVNVTCNKHCLLCTTCTTALQGTCSIACRTIIQEHHTQLRIIPAKTATALSQPHDS